MVLSLGRRPVIGQQDLPDYANSTIVVKVPKPVLYFSRDDVPFKLKKIIVVPITFESLLFEPGFASS
jgi:CMP-2-keto-3-deoxyoctulosonic acid synthetase